VRQQLKVQDPRTAAPSTSRKRRLWDRFRASEAGDVSRPPACCDFGTPGQAITTKSAASVT
jgi:hypothetical protein